MNFPHESLPFVDGRMLSIVKINLIIAIHGVINSPKYRKVSTAHCAVPNEHQPFALIVRKTSRPINNFCAS